MEQLFVTVGASTLYAVALSVGYGKKLDEWAVTRPLVVAGGVAIVLAGFTYAQRDWMLFNDLMLWFFWSAIPQVVRVAILFVREMDHRQVKRHSLLGGEHDGDA